jgi:hypothetical protein
MMNVAHPLPRRPCPHKKPPRKGKEQESRNSSKFRDNMSSIYSYREKLKSIERHAHDVQQLTDQQHQELKLMTPLISYKTSKN